MGPGPRVYALGRDDTLLLPSRLHPALEIDQRQRALVFGRLLDGAVIASVDLVPSNAMAGAASRPAPITTARNRNSAIRITRLLARPARMGDRAFDGRPYLLGVFPQITGAEFGLTRLPLALALGQLVGRQLDVQGAFLGIELDDVAVAQQRNRPAQCRF